MQVRALYSQCFSVDMWYKSKHSRCLIKQGASLFLIFLMNTIVFCNTFSPNEQA